jgi:rfaE bifunctional protein nucleotidyltransferase chain/domain
MNKNDFSKKIIHEYPRLAIVIEGLRAAGMKIVVTIGSWDMLHPGHTRYLTKGANFGDVLIVGVDSDTAIKKYKGPMRPLVPENERIEMLSNLPYVDYITLVDDVDDAGNWQYELIKIIKPDVFVAVVDSYPEAQIKEIEKYCKEVKVLPRQAEETSSSMYIQKVLKEGILPLAEELKTNVIPLIEGYFQKVERLANGHKKQVTTEVNNG